ncbi:hypothetical protein E3N88_23052 [Mikania micrantha]|uniref:Retrotransposon Copia-like N-terminal domain-containing protein n=1 Tax=Mikania micrantha TaxID=192012 RepID=A0A5N6NC74_9ASTR|nr:hypothetical protein E3N88_23052 [Mikania micrantha]
MKANNAYEVALQTVVVDLLKVLSSITKRTPKFSNQVYEKQEVKVLLKQTKSEITGPADSIAKSEKCCIIKDGSGCFAEAIANKEDGVVRGRKYSKSFQSLLAKRFMRGKLLFLTKSEITGPADSIAKSEKCCIIKDGSGCFAEAIANKQVPLCRRSAPLLPSSATFPLPILMASDSNSESPIITTIPISTPSLTIVHFPSSLKLISTNYLGWKTQVEAILHGLDLFKFIDGTHPPPPPTIDPAGCSIPHPDFLAWFRQDRLLFGALVGTLSPPIVPLITNASSSLDAWNILSNTYASPSRGHIKQLQHRLKQSTKSTSQSVTDYMQSVKTLVDEVSLLGK